jgi:hypothetical protein
MVKCTECGNEYKQLAQHWRHSPSHRPNLTQKQIEVTTGLLMGDGSIRNRHKSYYLKTAMISPNYLKYLDKLFGCLGTGVKLKSTAEESAKQIRNSGCNENAKKENYSDIYRWQTRSHPKFNEFYEWYSSGKKVWPENIELTSTVLKHLYVGDGNYKNSGSNNHIRIAMANEVENTEKVSQYFTNAGLPEPSNYSICERKSGAKTCNAAWTKRDSHTLWDYMGKPLPDFEYKWPEEYR